MNTVLILGANGRLGQAATQAFARAGWRVLAQMRRAPVGPANALPAGAQALVCALHDCGALAAQAGGASVVLHAVNPPYTRWSTQALPLLRQGLALARTLGARFVLQGNVYNFGQGMPALLQEGTAQRPSTAKGRIRCDMEAEIQAHTQATGQHAVVLRAGDFYGCGSGSWLDLAIAKGLRQGQLVYPGPLDRVHAWTYLPDLAQALVAVAGLQGRPALETLHFAGHALTGHDFIAALQAAAADLGLGPKGAWRLGRMPWTLIRTVGLVYPLWRELAAMQYLWQVPHALDGTRLAQVAGPLASTPPQAALRQALIDLGMAPAAAQTAPRTVKPMVAPDAP